MANSNHIEWLLRGTEEWNSRRESEDFKPDFEKVNIRELFEQADKLSNDGSIPLSRVNLKNANLKGAILHRANLRGALFSDAELFETDLRSADLREANFWQAQLIDANLKRANLQGAFLVGAVLMGANLHKTNLQAAHVRSVFAEEPINSTTKINRTDLSLAKGLTQNRLESMYGDSETKIPFELVRPKNWPIFGEADFPTNDRGNKSAAAEVETGKALREQIAVILSTPVKHLTTVEQISAQIDYAISIFRSANRTNEQPEDLLLAERFSEKLKQIHKTLSGQNDDRETRLNEQLPELLAIIEDLNKTIDRQAKEIQEYKSQKPERTDLQKMRSAFAISFGTALGAGTAATLISAGDTLLGNYGAATMDNLRDAFSSFFRISPEVSPSTFPPSIST